MHTLHQLLGASGDSIVDYDSFWSWFWKNERSFHRVLRKGTNVNEAFFDKVTPRLTEVKEGLHCLAGMIDEHTAELIITADGVPANIVFAEELVKVAPTMPGWKVVALKSSVDLGQAKLHVDNLVFSADTLRFYGIEHPEYPDEVDITVLYRDYDQGEQSTVRSAVFTFLDAYLGELNALLLIDHVNVIALRHAEKDTIGMDKLKDYLRWREAEFVEGYERSWPAGDNAMHLLLEAELGDGSTALATINSDLLKWEHKASYQWIVILEVPFSATADGLPDNDTQRWLSDLEELLKAEIGPDRCVSIGRQTAQGQRDIYLACREFREPSKILYRLSRQYPQVQYDIFKDKYWKYFKRFVT